MILVIYLWNRIVSAIFTADSCPNLNQPFPDMAAAAVKTGRHFSQTALLDHFHMAAAEANLNDYFGCFYSISSRFLGTDATENWSALEFYDYCKPHFDAGSAWSYVPRITSRKFEHISSPDGTPLITTFDELLDVESFGATARGTGTVIFDKESKVWFVISYHLSFPTPNELAHEICKKISLFEKKSAAKLSNDRSDAVAAELLAEFEIDSINEKGDSSKKSKSKKKKEGK